MIVVYTAEPRSKSAEAFSLLASWAATEETTSAESDHADADHPNFNGR
jgi:hypothetical protein